MSTIAASTDRGTMQMHPLRPSFLGMVRGEFIKISRMWLTWIMLVLLLGATTLPYLILATSPTEKDALIKTPLKFLYEQTDVGLSITRIFIGFFLIILTAYVIGQEFQFGTIRILLARGLGRLQLLFAKVLTIVIIALALFVFSMIIHLILSYGVVAYLGGNLNALKALTPVFWPNTMLYMLTVLLSMGATLLMATAASVVCRSLALGLAVSIAFFAVDNIGLEFLYIAYRVTDNQFWLNITAYALGPNLNTMPRALLSASSSPRTIGISPFVHVDGLHTLWVTLVYSLIFVAVAIVPTWMRDVKE